MTTTKKLAIAVVALSLALFCAIGGTLAFLVAESNTVTNTFTYGDINIELWENDYVLSSNSLDTSKKVTSEEDYKMVPGNTMPKNPTVTVLKDSEACWLFIQVEKTNNPDTYLDYAIHSCWTALAGEDGVYYYNGTDLDQLLTADKTYSILAGDKVTVKTTVTKTEMTNIGTNYPTLTFTAYAVQKANVDNLADAWTIANNNGQLPTT